MLKAKMYNTRGQEYFLTTKHNKKGDFLTVEDKNYYKKSIGYDSHLKFCESFGISRTVINLFIHLQEQKHEQNHKKTSNSRIPNKSDC